ncbi:DUF1963 domain-containing protein [Nocardiopsis exhalans]|uniref:DUF1963 domain-containing protein n=1 Tax=Nocardiopsis exhalans TaxID=163604 RepID=A0ABY5DIR5_9ACTN|nr:DUF1963 domain-containing protein [Nocardiopsis exhalans]USY22955.1 DUF1963 domain-containing protein [Nocardiopsis exhalans]
MPRTTPPRPVEVEELFPELRPWRREALRLHPRRGNPAVHESSVGGPLLWPADEPWPTCEAEHDLGRDEDAVEIEGAPDFVPVVQLHRNDALGVEFPPGKDLLQVLWCPFDHPGLYCPLPRVYWRTTASLGEVRSTPPVPDGARAEHVPAPCVVHPEPVVDYPSWDLPEDLSDQLSERFEQLEKETGWQYEDELAEAPGIKMGGYPSWTQDPLWPECEGCGETMEHLLTVSSAEYDGDGSSTWIPVEDRDGGDLDVRDRVQLQRPHGLMLGDMGGVYVFECRTCPDRPFTHHFDCS